MHRSNWTSLIMPNNVKVVDQSEDGKSARFTCEPLMKGYGTTLGNSLRRILLSTLKGSAVIAVKMKGVEHEFTTVSGIREDVVDIMMNIKQVRFLAHEDKLHHLVLKANKKGVVTAGDIEDTAAIKVLNKDLKLFELDEDIDFEIEFLVMSGRGYIPAEEHDSSLYSEGYIALDSFFSPIVHVNYNINSARVKNSFNYDKLIFDIETDGSISPRDALAYAAMILREHTKFFINFSIEKETLIESVKQDEEVNWNLYKTIDDLDLSVRSHNCLKNASINYVGELVQRTENEMLKTKNFGRKSLNEIKLILLNSGLHFGMEIDNFPDEKIINDLEKKGKIKE